MKLNKLFTVGLLLMGICSSLDVYGQMECQKLVVQANKELSKDNFKGAADFYLKSERFCHDIGAENFYRFISALIEVSNNSGEQEQITYIDHILRVYDKMENMGHYYPSIENDLNRGYYYLHSSEPDIYMADQFFQRAFTNPGVLDSSADNFIQFYFYNIYTMWYVEQDSYQKAELKQYLVDAHAYLSELITEFGAHPSNKEYLDQVLNMAK